MICKKFYTEWVKNFAVEPLRLIVRHVVYFFTQILPGILNQPGI